MRHLAHIALIIASLSAPPVWAETTRAQVKQLSDAVLSHDDWLADSAACPSEGVPARERALGDNLCAHTLQDCLTPCRNGNGDACYWLAIGLQEKSAPAAVVTALQQRACKLGVVSGCTNRAADMLAVQRADPDAVACTAKTFSKACAVNDPWACTMAAMQLSRGLGVAKDVPAALKLLDKSCRFGEDDPACEFATQLRTELQGAPSADADAGG